MTIEKRLEEQKLNKKEKKRKKDGDDEIDPGEDEKYCGGQIHPHLLGDDGPDHQRVEYFRNFCPRQWKVLAQAVGIFLCPFSGIA